MCTVLRNFAVVKHDDLIGVHHRLQTMCDDQHGFILHKLVNGTLDQDFILGVKACGRFIETRLKRFPLYRIALLSELYISKTYHQPLKSRLIYPKNYVKL